jgi:hypothetical protein
LLTQYVSRRQGSYVSTMNSINVNLARIEGVAVKIDVMTGTRTTLLNRNQEMQPVEKPMIA